MQERAAVEGGHVRTKTHTNTRART